MKSNFYLIAASMLVLAACNPDENKIEKPVISILELGEGETHGNDHTALVGGDLHVEVDVVAEGKISTIQVKIHPEGEHHEKAANEEWEIDTTYTKFAGLKNTLFHEHLKIDSTAEAGDYHFDFTVTDMDGNQSSAEADLSIVEE